MKPRTWKVIAAAAVAGLSAVALQASASAASDRATTSAPPQAAAALPFSPDTETVFHPITSTRILDTGTSLGGHPGKISSTAPFNLQVTGPIVPAGASAVVFSLTVVAPTVSSFLTIWPTGVAQPAVSNISYAAGQTITSSSTVRLSADGKITIKPGSGSTHVRVDLAGYYSTSTAWGQSGYVAWVVADDFQVYGSHVNRGTGVSRSHIEPGVNAFTFPGSNISLDSHSVATATIQVSVIGPTGSVCFIGTTSIPGGTETVLRVRVDCVHADNLTPVNALFFLQVAG